MVVPVSRGRDQGLGRWNDLLEVPCLIPKSVFYVNLPAACLAKMSELFSSHRGNIYEVKKKKKKEDPLNGTLLKRCETVTTHSLIVGQTRWQTSCHALAG